MSAKLLDGKLVSKHLREKIKKTVAQQENKPGLAVILVGDDSASHVYVKNKQLACKDVGFHSETHQLPDNATQKDVLEIIDQLNQNPKIHGILLQLPLPKHLDSGPLLEAIHPKKDVDGFHPYNLGRLAQRRPLLRPCTPYGIMQLLNYYKIDPKKLQSTVIGASNIVGRPMALELLLAGATVTCCHRFTENLANYVNAADLLIVAAGKQGIIQSEWIKPGAIVVDVGIHRLASGKLAGDIEFESAKEIAGWISPVPGGVGPMTITALLENTLIASQNQSPTSSLRNA